MACVHRPLWGARTHTLDGRDGSFCDIRVARERTLIGLTGPARIQTASTVISAAEFQPMNAVHDRNAPSADIVRSRVRTFAGPREPADRTSRPQPRRTATQREPPVRSVRRRAASRHQAAPRSRCRDAPQRTSLLPQREVMAHERSPDGHARPHDLGTAARRTCGCIPC